MDSLVSRTLARHGIGRQVLAAQVVRGADELFAELLPAHARHDVRAVSFVRDELVVASKHSAAAYACEGLSQDIISQLHARFPSAVIRRMIVRVTPDIFDV